MGMCNDRDSLSLDRERARSKRETRERTIIARGQQLNQNRRDHGRLWRKYTCRSPGIVICRRGEKVLCGFVSMDKAQLLLISAQGSVSGSNKLLL